MVEVHRREGESPNALIYRFTKKIQQSGILREVKKRRFHRRPENRLKIKLSALHREKRREEMKRAKKWGLV